MQIVILEDRGIYEKGQEIDTPYPHARQWVVSGFAVFADGRVLEEEEPKPEPEKSEYADLKVSQLDILLEDRKLSTGGNKADKVARLDEYKDKPEE